MIYKKAVRYAHNLKPFIETSLSDWELAGERSFKLRGKGITNPITDCLIAAIAFKHNAKSMTLDRRFMHIPDLKLLDTGTAFG